MTSERNQERGFMYQRKKIKNAFPLKQNTWPLKIGALNFAFSPSYVRLPETLAKKNPNNIILHIQIKNSANETSRYVFNRTLS